MKNKLLALALSSVTVAVLVMGCGSTSSSTQKVGEVESSSDNVSESENVQTEYHVGDILKDGDMQIVYVASGEYHEANEYSQPQDGNKFIFMKFSMENQSEDSDLAVSDFSFQCYADGYSCEEHYTDDYGLSATLSPGRSTSGSIVFEVPENANEIEVEYETNFFTEKKITFIYDGDKDSGYVSEKSAEASESAYSVGDIVKSDTLNITYLSCENDKSYSSYMKPEAGYHYETLTFEFENVGDSDEFISFYDFDCYADGNDCEMAYFRDDALSATLSAGRKASGTVTFTVPDDASVVECEYVSNFWTSSRVVFTVENN